MGLDSDTAGRIPDSLGYTLLVDAADPTRSLWFSTSSGGFNINLIGAGFANVTQCGGDGWFRDWIEFTSANELETSMPYVVDPVVQQTNSHSPAVGIRNTH